MPNVFTSSSESAPKPHTHTDPAYKKIIPKDQLPLLPLEEWMRISILTTIGASLLLETIHNAEKLKPFVESLDPISRDALKTMLSSALNEFNLTTDNFTYASSSAERKSVVEAAHNAIVSTVSCTRQLPRPNP